MAGVGLGRGEKNKTKQKKKSLHLTAQQLENCCHLLCLPFAGSGKNVENLGKEISVLHMMLLSLGAWWSCLSLWAQSPLLRGLCLCSLEFGAAFGWGLGLGWPGLRGCSPTPVLGQVELGLRLGLGWDSGLGWRGSHCDVIQELHSCRMISETQGTQLAGITDRV